MQRIFMLVIPFLALGWASACETIEGAGQDIQDAGQAIEEEAEEADNY